MTKINFSGKLIRNNTGVSVKNFAVFWGVIIAVVWVLIYLPAFIILDQIWGYKITLNLYGITALIGAIEAILAILITGKVKSEQYERHNNYSPYHERTFDYMDKETEQDYQRDIQP